MANVSRLTHDVQRSNEVVHTTHDVREGITYLFLVFSTTLWRTSTISWCRKKTQKEYIVIKPCVLAMDFQ
jgi:hypothetical protein